MANAQAPAVEAPPRAAPPVRPEALPREGKVKKFLKKGILGTTSFAFAHAEIVFIVAAFIKYLLELSRVLSTSPTISLIFFLLAIATILEGKGYLLAILVWIQLTYFGLAFNANIIYTVIPIIFVYLFLFGLERVKRDLGSLIVYLGLVIYVIDAGLFSLIAKEYGLAMRPVFERIILLTPWWVLFGIVKIKVEEMEKGALRTFVQFLRFIALLYIISITLIAAAPEGGFQTQIGPGFEEAIKAREEALEKAKEGLHPVRLVVIQTTCGITNPADVPGCVERERIKLLCGEFKKEAEKLRIPSEEHEPYVTCQQQVTGVAKVIEAVGGVDPTIKEFTKFEITKGEGFPTEIFARQPMPVELRIENPRLSLDVVMNCQFTSGTRNITGTVAPSGFSVEKGKQEKSVICVPLEELPEGSVTMVVEATISNLQTTSRLRRLFIGEKSEEEKKELKRDYFPAGQELSLSPPEFVRINFLIGEPPTNPLIDNKDNPILIATIENIGKGEIVNIGKAEISMVEGLRVVPDPKLCNLIMANNKLIQSDFKIEGIGKKQKIPFGVCALEMDTNLRNPEEYFVNKEFTAVIDYTYKVRKQFSFRVVKVVGIT